MLKISVVIPVYNASKSIENVLDCVFNQTVEVLEVIIVNDASNDNTDKVLEDYGNRLKSKNKLHVITLSQNKGVSFCRNLGWDNAKGDFVAFLDSDDFWNLNKIEIIVNILKNNTSISFLGHLYSENNISINRNLFFDEKLLKLVSFGQMLLFNRFQTSCVLISNDISERFNVGISHSEDYELFLRLSAMGHKIFIYNEKLTYLGRRQLTKGGLSGKKYKMRLGEIKAYRTSLKIKKMSYVMPILVLYSFFKSLIKLHR